MKKVLGVLILSQLFLFSSCLDYLLPNDEIEVGTRGLVLFHAGGLNGYMLARPTGSSNYQPFIGIGVTNVFGNDSILLVDSYHGYFKIILSELDSKKPVLIELEEYMALKIRISIKYNVGANPKYD